MQKEPFDKEEAEKKELNLLLRRGIKFSVPKSKLFAMFSRKKEREFTIVSQSLGAMHMLSVEYMKLAIDAETFDKDPWIETKKLPLRLAPVMARIVAIAVLGRLSYVPYISYLFKVENSILINIYANYFLLKIDAEKLYQITSIVIDQAHYQSFLNSTTSLTVNLKRTTEPVPEVVEQNQKETA